MITPSVGGRLNRQMLKEIHEKVRFFHEIDGLSHLGNHLFQLLYEHDSALNSARSVVLVQVVGVERHAHETHAVLLLGGRDESVLGESVAATTTFLVDEGCVGAFITFPIEDLELFRPDMLRVPHHLRKDDAVVAGHDDGAKHALEVSEVIGPQLVFRRHGNDTKHICFAPLL